MHTQFFQTISLGLLLAALSGCNTIAGAGTDIRRGGEHITNAAESVKAKM